MLHTIIFYQMDGTTFTTTTEAQTTKAAHEQARKDKRATTAEQIRIYPTTTDESGALIEIGIARGALMVARKSAAKSCERSGGNDTQYRILNELTAAKIQAEQTAAESLGAAYVFDVVARTSADSQEFFAQAYSGILDGIANGESIAEQYHRAYIEINHYIMKQKAATEYEYSNEFIQESGGALVAINRYIAKLIKGGERYAPYINEWDEMDEETADRLGAALKAAAATITPRQKQIAALLGGGLSQRTIAQRLNIKSVSTVSEHITYIRKKYLDYFTTNAPEFLYIIRAAEVNSAKGTNANKVKRNKTPEYYREYRAKKKAKNN